MSHRRRPRGAPTHPNTHRWDTTLTSDLESVAKQLEGSDYYNTGKRTKTLMDRKLANTKTSISFGNYKVCGSPAVAPACSDVPANSAFPCQHFVIIGTDTNICNFMPSLLLLFDSIITII